MSSDGDRREVTVSVSWDPDAPATDGGGSWQPTLDDATRRELTVLLARVEAVDWSAVPNVSAATASAFGAALEAALDAEPDGDGQHTHDSKASLEDFV